MSQPSRMLVTQQNPGVIRARAKFSSRCDDGSYRYTHEGPRCDLCGCVLEGDFHVVTGIACHNDQEGNVDLDFDILGLFDGAGVCLDCSSRVAGSISMLRDRIHREKMGIA